MNEANLAWAEPILALLLFLSRGVPKPQLLGGSNETDDSYPHSH